MPCPAAHAAKIAQAAASAWWKTHGTSRDEIPLGVVAALALTTRADPAGPDPASLILDANRDEIAALLRRIWTLFAITRPELSIRTGPFAEWLDDPSDAQLDGARATAGAVIKAGQLKLTADRRAQEVDLLGHVYQELRNPRAGKARGEVYTPTGLALAIARMTLTGAEPGQSICDPCAGTGGLLLAAARELRSQGTDPSSMHWYAADIDLSPSPAWPSTCTYGISARTSWWARRTRSPRPTGQPGPYPSRSQHSNGTTRGSPSPASSRPSAC